MHINTNLDHEAYSGSSIAEVAIHRHPHHQLPATGWPTLYAGTSNRYYNEKLKYTTLTHFSLMEFPTIINWNSPFLFYRGRWVFFFNFVFKS